MRTRVLEAKHEEGDARVDAPLLLRGEEPVPQATGIALFA